MEDWKLMPLDVTAQQAMENHGFVACPVMDGKIHRFDVDGKKAVGWYCFHGDGIPAGSFGNWVTGEKHKWCEKGETDLDPVERSEYLNKLEKIKQSREKLQQEEYIAASDNAHNLYYSLPAAEYHEYLTKKQIRPFFARQHPDGSLVIPVFSGDDKIQSLQMISSIGAKLFFPGGKMKGGFLPIGNGVYDPVLICEGYATGCTLFSATGYDVYVSFTANNLSNIVQTVKNRHPSSKIVLCCDNDQWTKDNPGLTKGKSAAESIGAYYSFPVFKDDVLSAKPTDFNDLMLIEGIEEVKLQVLSATTTKQEANKPPAKKPKINIDNVYTSDQMFDAYLNYIKTLKDNRFLTGISEIDKRIRGVSGGEVMTIIARAGSFKTAMLQNMLLNYVQHSAWASVFFSLEMPVSSVTERYMSITTGEEGREIEGKVLNHFATGKNSKEIDEMRQFFNDRMQRIFVVPVKVSLDGAAGYVKLIETEFKTKIGVIGIDYMGLIDGDGKNEYEVVSNVARGAKELAKEINLPTIILCQASRSGGTGEEEITLDMGRGSGAIEEGGDFILGLWQNERKNGLGRPTGEFDLICRILKNRKGPKCSRWKLDVNVQDLSFGDRAEEFIPETKKNKKEKNY
jgi:putative DNA primase/helicase